MTQTTSVFTGWKYGTECMQLPTCTYIVALRNSVTVQGTCNNLAIISPLVFVDYSDSQSGPTVQWYQVQSVLSDLQKSVREKYPAVRVIHALAGLEGVTVESSNGREKIISSTAELAGGGAYMYDHLMKMLEVDPNHFQRVLERAEPLLQGGEVHVPIISIKGRA